MISQIKFDNELVITREEAITLGLSYRELFGRRLGYCDGKLKALSSCEFLKGIDCTYDEETGTYINNKGGSVPSYYLNDPLSDQDRAKDWVIIPHETYMVDLLLFSEHCNYPFKIYKSIGVKDAPVSNINHILNHVEDKLTLLNKAIDLADNFNFNSKCNVHIGGGLLVTFNDLKLLEDVCTDELQRSLNDGWRILAVCAQNDQRRPDYVLGRYNPDMIVNNNDVANRIGN